MSVNVGIDVGKDYLDICLLHDQTKSGRKHRKFKNTKGTHSEISRWLIKVSKCKPEDTLITMESTGVYHESIARTYMLLVFAFSYRTQAKHINFPNH
ncbi:IS110 family transposase [Photobacterium damselae]|uniref:IS110 family transposase n=1 Tax=Photobacterium damselae TaxID=38293 RepID=UPI0035A8DBDF